MSFCDCTYCCTLAPCSCSAPVPFCSIEHGPWTLRSFRIICQKVRRCQSPWQRCGDQERPPCNDRNRWTLFPICDPRFSPSSATMLNAVPGLFQCPFVAAISHIMEMDTTLLVCHKRSLHILWLRRI